MGEVVGAYLQQHVDILDDYGRGQEPRAVDVLQMRLQSTDEDLVEEVYVAVVLCVPPGGNGLGQFEMKINALVHGIDLNAPKSVRIRMVDLTAWVYLAHHTCQKPACACAVICKFVGKP